MLRYLFSICQVTFFAALFALPAQGREPSEPKEVPTGKSSPQDKTAEREVRNSVYLGIFTVPLRGINNRVKKGLHLKDDNGVIIVEVLPDSPATQAGLREKDVITRVNGEAIADQAALCAELNQLGAGRRSTCRYCARARSKSSSPDCKKPRRKLSPSAPMGGPEPAALPPRELPGPLGNRCGESRSWREKSLDYKKDCVRWRRPKWSGNPETKACALHTYRRVGAFYKCRCFDRDSCEEDCHEPRKTRELPPEPDGPGRSSAQRGCFRGGRGPVPGRRRSEWQPVPLSASSRRHGHRCLRARHEHEPPAKRKADPDAGRRGLGPDRARHLRALCEVRRRNPQGPSPGGALHELLRRLRQEAEESGEAGFQPTML